MTNIKNILIGVAIGIAVAFVGFMVFFSIKTLNNAKKLVANTSQPVQYINAGIAVKLLPSIEDIQAKLPQ